MSSKAGSLLSGYRILAVEQYGAAPFGTQYLADMGAEIIKIEQPDDGGDVGRHVGPHFMEGLPETARSIFYQGLNAGKKSITLNLRKEEGRAIFRKLVPTAHAVASNLRGDVPARLGLTYDQLRDTNPAIVCAHLTGYGRDGERANWPGYDYLMQAEAGYFSLTGEPDSPPSRMGLSMVDYMTGVVMSLGLVSGVLNAQRSGVGCDVDVSLYDVALHNLNYVGHWYLNAGKECGREQRSSHPSLTPCQLYRTADGWIYLMCNKEKFWTNLCEKIDRPAWVKDARFHDFAARLQHRHLLTGMLDGVLSERTTAEWMKVFAASVPAAPILSVGEALDAPFAQTGDRIRTIATPDGGSMRILRSPLRTSRPDDGPRLSPRLGEDTAAVLAAIGIGAEEQQGLKERGIV